MLTDIMPGHAQRGLRRRHRLHHSGGELPLSVRRSSFRPIGMVEIFDLMGGGRW